MNTPLPEPTPPLLSKPRPHLPLPVMGSIGVIVILLLIIGSVGIVKLEEQRRAEVKTLIPSPKVTDPAVTPTPEPTYQPQIPGMTKEEALQLFRSVTFDTAPYENDSRLARWNAKEIEWSVHGQYAPEDEQCLTHVMNQLNTNMEATQLVRKKDASTFLKERETIKFFILPADQFSSIHPDIRPDEPIHIFASNERVFSYFVFVVNLDISTQTRCYMLRELALRSIGIIAVSADSHPPLAETIIDNATISPTVLEAVRILYSPLLTAELTYPEIERRLLQE